MKIFTKLKQHTFYNTKKRITYNLSGIKWIIKYFKRSWNNEQTDLLEFFKNNSFVLLHEHKKFYLQNMVCMINEISRLFNTC